MNAVREGGKQRGAGQQHQTGHDRTTTAPTLQPQIKSDQLTRDSRGQLLMQLNHNSTITGKRTINSSHMESDSVDVT